jgi:hypothetical protein
MRGCARTGLAVPEDSQLYREVVPGSRDDSRDDAPLVASARLPPSWSMAPKREAEDADIEVPEHVQRRCVRPRVSSQSIVRR